ncbi:hypothetical protein EOPP23_18975 [Endozoicomonas sp. OPT23]|uniref:glycosyltransferase n=1 Tax=Endozoicomonas sp. OPT23 TaxID=2072845 RepID=UPI00129B76D6|nr:glycosyltransferase [Endozoicomonas sp. OPT23]MRI35056.1 hypothetical protein [Endozoicomonas sp. OPT23]
MSSSLFGALVSWYSYDNRSINGLRKANEDFIRAVIRYSNFDQLHLFFLPEQIERFTEDNRNWMQLFGADKKISLISVNELPEYLAQYTYTVFHQGDHHLVHLAELRNQFSETLFPVTGRAHSLSDDPSLSRARDLILAPLKACDAILCSSSAQKKVMSKLLSAASASLSDSVGIAVPFSGQVSSLPLGMAITESRQDFGNPVNGVMKAELKNSLGLDRAKPVILCLGRVTAADKVDLQPLLVALNNLIEQKNSPDFQLVVAGAGDPGSEEIRMLTSMAYELNLEDRVRFELSIDEPRKQMLLSASDIFVSISDNTQESFGLAIVEAMKAGLAVVASDWNGHRDLIEHGQSGYLIETQTLNCELLSRPLSLLNKPIANFIEAQSTAVNSEKLTVTLSELLADEQLRLETGAAARSRAEELYDWPVVMAQYHDLVDQLGTRTEGQYQSRRLCGTPYLDAFGHYPSHYLQQQSLLQTTDRGLRVYLESERHPVYKQLRFLFDQENIRTVLEQAISGEEVVKLQSLIKRDNGAAAVLGWMLKHNLLKTVDSKVQRNVPYRLKLPEYIDDCGVVYPESIRSELLKPVVSHFVDCLRQSVKQPLVCEQSLAQLFAGHMDVRLFQAICWYGEEEQLLDYHEMLKQLQKAGGLAVLAERYPLWFRNSRRQFIRELKQYRRLLTRFNKNLSDINRVFFADETQAADIIEVKSLFSEQAGRVYKLTLNSGQQLVYKERNLRVDNALTGKEGLMANLAGWLSDFPCPVVHNILPLADEQGDFGFTEYVETESSVASYQNYQKALGALAGFCLMSGQGDIHHLNVLIKNGLPCLIDAEAPFHNPVIMSLASEINNPEAAFARGLRESSLGHTNLLDIWESFHTFRVSLCSHELVNGSLQESPAQQFQAVTIHCLQQGARHVLDGRQPSLAVVHSKYVEEGFEQAVRAIIAHADLWCQALQGLSQEAISYKPRLDCVAVKQQSRHSFVEKAFQQLSLKDSNDYFRRMAHRIAGAAEINQRWLEPQWQEPSSKLSNAVYKSFVRQHDIYFSRVASDHPCSMLVNSGKGGKVVENFFATNPCDALVNQVAGLASNKDKLEDFLKCYKSALEDWFKNDCQPGRGLGPDHLKEVVNRSGLKPEQSG